MCVITTAFLAIARAQQRALGYPDLPFVMLEHPVAVATDEEIEQKVEAVYGEFVAGLTGGSARAGGEEAAGGKAASEASGVAGAPAETGEGESGALARAISPVRQMLRADGADLRLASREGGTLRLRLLFTDSVCEECILPRGELEEMLAGALRESGEAVSRVVLEDPREKPPAGGR